MAGSSEALCEIIHYGDLRLRQRCRDVAADEDVGSLATRMWATLRAAKGIGLAAPQVGDLRRLIVVRDARVKAPHRLVLVNPVITAFHGPRVPFEEGCLSFPGLYMPVRRPRGITVQFRDPAGAAQEISDDGLLARVVQHEVDHLDGILFIDHLPPWRRWLLAWRLERLRRGHGGTSA